MDYATIARRRGRFRRGLKAHLLASVAVIALSLRPAEAGPTFYDLNSLLFEPPATEVRRPAPLPPPYPQPALITQPAVVPRPIVAPLPAPPALPAAPVRRPVAAAAPVPRPVRPAEIAERKWQPHADIVGKLGTDRFIGEVDLFMPLRQDRTSMWFVNLRGQADDEDNLEGNFGLGLRRIFGDDVILGGYGYVDVRDTEHDNTFYQAVLGFEALSTNWDFRINGYIPEDDKEPVPGSSSVKVTGNTILESGFERALPGFDAEVGWRLQYGEDTRVYFGGYRFNASGFDTVAGPRARAEMRLHDLAFLGLGSRLTLGATLQWDEPRGAQALAVVRLRAPFGELFGGPPAQRLTALERRMVDPVVRDIDVVTSSGRGNP